MRELKASNKNGQAIISRADSYKGTLLDDVYGSYSKEKEKAYKWCREQYSNDMNSKDFHICSANTYGFTCAWYTIYNGEPILRFETKDNTYIVYLNK